MLFSIFLEICSIICLSLPFSNNSILEFLLFSEKYKDIISNFVTFHIKLNQKPEIKRDIINYTIREISLFIQAFTDSKNKLFSSFLFISNK